MGAAASISSFKFHHLVDRLNEQLVANQDGGLRANNGVAPTVTRVLLVEADLFSAHRLHECLSETPSRFEVVHVEKVAQALRQLDKNDFDVIILDLSQPDARGITGFMRMHAAHRNIPVIVITGEEERFIGARALMAGATAHLIKGQLDPRDMRQSIRKALLQINKPSQQQFLLPRASNSDLCVVASNAAIKAQPRSVRSDHLRLC